ncbi:ribonuclease, Rne/Rng family [Halobacteroides halobius DSM 5150]|uniref:Ribonuclease, Rne/Rng family n=1 Tax=Halobacteroides halobius (strain ATCC 35273 / DSM 5150 / MD-1) TaxID=748449 RepID=L0KBH4_HALHC|nr:ribonuclease, Rne/Rng family [Halobacteroides halobius DSM 5150]
MNGQSLKKRIAILEDRELIDLLFEQNFSTQLVGNIYKGRVENVVSGIQAAFVNIGTEQNVFLPINSVLPYHEEAKIEQVLQPGQKVVVQVDKDPVGTKGPKGSSKLELPGRYLILMDEPGHIGVSRRIDGPERGRLRVLAREIIPDDKGAIVRTEAAYRKESEIKRELNYLLGLRKEIEAKSRQASTPSLIYEELDLINQVIRDRFNKEVDRLVVDTASDYQQVMDFVEHLAPDLKGKVYYYQESEPVFSNYGIEEQIQNLLNREVELDSGGYIVIDSTEALTAIDVNTGTYSGDNIADTILQTNLEAAREIANQLRLRNLSGIIIIDFIGLKRDEDEEILLNELEEELAKDKTRTSLLGMTELGLVEVTRQREENTIGQLLQKKCSCCQGQGKVLTSETIIQQAFTRLKAEYWQKETEAILLSLNPTIVGELIKLAADKLQDLTTELEAEVYLLGNDELNQEAIKLESGTKDEIKNSLPVKVRERLVVKIEEKFNQKDGLAKIDGYLIKILEAAMLVGDKVKVEVIKLTNLYAIGKIIRTINTK